MLRVHVTSGKRSILLEISLTYGQISKGECSGSPATGRQALFEQLSVSERNSTS